MSALLKNLNELSKKTFQKPELKLLQGGNDLAEPKKENFRRYAALGGIAGFLIIGIIISAIKYSSSKKTETTNSALSQKDMQKMLYTQSVVQYNAKSFAEAKKGFSKLFEMNSKDSVTINNFGLALKANGELQEAKAIYLLGLKSFPRDATLLNNYANLEFEHGSISIAEKHFLQSLEARPNYKEAMINLAHLYETKGEWEKSLSLYEQYLKNKNTDPNLVEKLKERIRKINSLSLSNKNRGARI